MKQRIEVIYNRFKNNPKYKYFFLEKLISSLLIDIIQLIFYPFRYLFMGHVSINTYISADSSFKNVKNIYLGNKTQINKGVILWAGLENGISIGNNSQINPYVAIYGDVKIGDYVMIAPHVMLAGGNHGYNLIDVPMIFQNSTSKGGIVIDDDVWIGANSTILDGIRIEKGAIIAAGSIVTKNVSAYDIVAGTPARVIANRLNSNQ